MQSPYHRMAKQIFSPTMEVMAILVKLIYKFYPHELSQVRRKGDATTV